MGGIPTGLGPPYRRTTATRSSHNPVLVADHDVGDPVPRFRGIRHEIRELCQLAISKITPSFLKNRFLNNK